MADAFFLTLGGLLLAINLNLFLVQVAPGGVSGAAILIHHFTDLIGVTMFVPNLPLLVLGYQNLGRHRHHQPGRANHNKSPAEPTLYVD